VTAPAHLKEIEDLFTVAMSDGTSSWHLGPDGEWTRHRLDDAGAPLVDLQDRTMRAVHRRRRARAVR
jgi:polyphosphate kinase